MNQIEQILQTGESPSVEFLASADRPGRVLEHVVALLNSGGGYLLIGVSDTGQPVGVLHARQVATTLFHHLIERISPKAYLDIEVEVVAGHDLLLVVVPGGKDAPFVADGRVFLRRGAVTAAASGPELQAMLQQRVAEVERWERRVAPTLTEEDLDQPELRTSSRVIQELRRVALPDGPFDDPFTLLTTLGMVARGQFTNAADICFGRNPALRQAQSRIRLFAFSADRRGDFTDQRTLAGPVVRLLEQAAAYIQERATLAGSFPEQLRREELAAYPLSVLREGLLNALAHRDYAAFSGGVTIEVYPTRVEIWNSGRLPAGWSAQRLRAQHPSLPTNPDIAHYLYLRGYMERIGSGTLKMIQVCQQESIPSPRWEADHDGVKLTLFSRASTLPAVQPLNARQEALLASLATEQSISVPGYLEEFAPNLSERQARRDLSKLVEAGLLQQQGKGPATSYSRTTRRQHE